MNKQICLFPGSFDPVTVGHMDLIRRAANLYDKVYVVVSVNIAKSGCFPIEMREKFLQTLCAEYPNVTVMSYCGLTAELAKKLDAGVILRGIRGVSDLEAEMTLARANKILAPETETVLLAADPEKEIVSSSVVREIGAFRGDLTRFVPEKILPEINNYFACQNEKE